MAGEARYSVGIDLGTTNSAMACADLAGEDAIEILAIPQLVNAGEVSEGSLLPSFLYVAGEFDFPTDSLRLPWPDDAARRWVVGELARKRGSENPSRLVASAKSWLSYAGASRTSPILPWGAPEEVPKLSPVAASARYLQHLGYEVTYVYNFTDVDDKIIERAQKEGLQFDAVSERNIDAYLRYEHPHFEIDQKQQIPDWVIERLFEMGVMGMIIPAE